jgi:hypothetical protein
MSSIGRNLLCALALGTLAARFASRGRRAGRAAGTTARVMLVMAESVDVF